MKSFSQSCFSRIFIEHQTLMVCLVRKVGEKRRGGKEKEREGKERKRGKDRVPISLQISRILEG
ncbi:Lon protease [Bienertia sinuspersici]